MMQLTKYFYILALSGLCLGLAGCVSLTGRDAYVVEEEGRGMVRALFDKRMKTAADQWEYARETQHKGHLRKAGQRMLYLLRRWPNSMEAPLAARARGDMLYARKQWQDSFEAYQFLIDNYSSRMRGYDEVLEHQFEIAVKLMNRRRMRWVFGGYRAPEYAVSYFERVIRNGPQWPKAAKAQMLIGQCYQEADDLEMAIASYEVLGYRYAESAFAEEAAWQQIICQELLHKEYPNSTELLDRLLTSTTVFLTTYPDSAHRSETILLRNTLYEVQANLLFSEGEFYEQVSRSAAAAVISYETLIEEYPKSVLVPAARKRVEVLRELLAKPKDAITPAPVRSRPLPFIKDRDNAVR